MYRFNRGLSRRVGELEEFFQPIPEPISAEERERLDARGEEMAAAVLEEREPVPALTDAERPIFEEMRRFRPILMELYEEGALDGYLDGDDALDPEDDDLDDG